MGCWGHDLFQSDHDFDIIGELASEAGLDDLQETEQAKFAPKSEEYEKIYYTIYGDSCSDVPVVRAHLDSGILEEMMIKKEAAMAVIPKTAWENIARDPCYIYVLLGACAMSLGCKIPDTYIKTCKKVYTEGGLMKGALKQMEKALFGPNAYKNGVPFNFESKDLVQTANSMEDRQTNTGVPWIGMNIPGPGGFFSTGMGDSESSAVIKELRAMRNPSNTCGGCGKKKGAGGGALLRCGKCKERRYCGAECQKKHWKVHKVWCEPAKE